MRRLMLVALMAIAVMASTTASASALSVQVKNPNTNIICPNVVVSGNQVTGGCRLEKFDGSWTFATKDVLVTFCNNSDFNVRVDSKGLLYATGADQLHCEWPSRQPCEAPNGEVLLWPGQIRAIGGGLFQADIDVCFAPPNNPTGGAWASITTDVIEHKALPLNSRYMELDQPTPPDPNLFIREGYWKTTAGSSFDHVTLIEKP